MKKEENNVEQQNEENVNDTVQEEVKEEKKPSDIVEELKAKLKAEKEKSDEYYDHLKRNMAEFDNFKKRISKEKDMMYNSISANIVSELLPIIDNFEKALNAETSDESYKNGMVMIYNQLIESLQKEVIEVFRKGYKIGDKIVRHAMVKVAN